MGSTGAGAVTANHVPGSRARSMLVPVNVIAGCTASGIAPTRSAGLEDPACRTRAAVCSTSWPGCQTPASASPATSAASSCLGHGEQHELAALDDLGDGQHRHAGEHGGRALPARLRHGGDPGEGVARAGEGGREHGADPAGADRADAEPPRAFSGHRPTPVVARTAPQ